MKTTQALKISATWTPGPQAAADMADAAFDRLGAARGIRFEGGRIGIRHAIKIDMTDPTQAVRVAERVAAIRADLEEIGRLHTFITSVGAVSVDAVEVLPEAAPEAETA